MSKITRYIIRTKGLSLRERVNCIAYRNHNASAFLPASCCNLDIPKAAGSSWFEPKSFHDLPFQVRGFGLVDPLPHPLSPTE